MLIFAVSEVGASTLNLSISSNPSRINPILANDSASSEISSWIFNGLFKYDKDGNIDFDLARSYHFEDATTLEIKLKKDVQWHDGEAFDASDVLFTYNTIISPKVFTSIAHSYQKVQSVKVIDSHTLKIKYKEPYFKALHIWMTGILPEHILKDETDLMTSQFNKKPIGTGPYRLKEFTFSSDITLQAYKKYHEGKANIDTIVYKFLPDPNTSFLYLKQQKLDVGSLSEIQIDRQVSDAFFKKFQVIEQPSFGYTYMGFNLRLKKFQDKAVRQALSLAIDRKQIVDILMFGHGRVCTGPFLPGSSAFNKEVTIPVPNLKQAKKLLRSAGYSANNPLEFEVVTNANNALRVYAAQIMQHQLEKIGVKMKIKVMEWQAFLNTVVHPRNFEAVILGWGLSLLPDAMALWHSSSDKKGGFNFVGYHNPFVDKLIEKASRIVQKKKFGAMYQKIFRIIAEDVPYLFLYIPNSITAVNKSIHPVKPALVGIMHNQNQWIKE